MKTINLIELRNGKPEIENGKMIIGVLAVKAKVYGIPQTVQFTVKEVKDGS